MFLTVTLSCIVDGNKKFRIFSGNFACGIVLENLVVQHALNGVHVGACQFAARRVTFQHNVADKTSTGGAVFNSRDSSPTAGSPLQFTTCVFRNNTAAGNGGVINVGRDPTGGPDVKIAKAIFTTSPYLTSIGTRFSALPASAGRGGAILQLQLPPQQGAGRGGRAIFTTSPYLTSICTRFSANTVVNGRGARGGGAILTTSLYLPSIGTLFSANTVVNGRGGAISLQAQGAVVQFCNSNFRRNRAPLFSPLLPHSPTLPPIHPLSLSPFPSARGGGAILTTSPILTSIGTRFSANAVTNGRGGAISIQAQGAVVQFCNSNFRRNRAPVGCTGCSGDCNGRGTCALASDLNPYCKC
ncbi:unnamed protein product [Closterium sp. Naga37s-1]|nr:unnamed protein product [Closterium sp. Naga37s-1]